MQVMQDCSTHDMVFSVAEVISFLSQVCLERLSLSCRALVFVSLVFERLSLSRLSLSCLERLSLSCRAETPWELQECWRVQKKVEVSE
jgi:hypothetical protein